MSSSLLPSRVTEQTSVGLTKVFGVAPFNLLSFIKRDVEACVSKAIAARVRTAIVLYGSTKQGKSALVEAVLEGIPYLRVSGARKSSVESVYRHLLILCGARIKTPREIEGEGKLGINTGWVQIELGGKAKEGSKLIEGDLSNHDTFFHILVQCTDIRTILIENFHFFHQDVQRGLAEAMRTSEAVKIGQRFLFIVLGTWHEENYLQTKGDLGRRAEAIPVEPWTLTELTQVLAQGEKPLNIRFSAKVQNGLVGNCEGNVGLLQEITKETLESLGIEQTQVGKVKFVHELHAVENAISKIVAQERESVLEKLRALAQHGSKILDKRRSYWIVKAIVSADRSMFDDGVPMSWLLGKTNELIRTQDSKAKGFEKFEFSNFVKNQWLADQEERIETPICAYKSHGDKLVIVDGWSKLVLKKDRSIFQSI